MRSSKWLVFIRSRLAGFHRSLTLLNQALGPNHCGYTTKHYHAHVIIRHTCAAVSFRAIRRGTSPAAYVEAFFAHYNHERNHQSLENRIIQPELPEFPIEGAVCCRKRLSGLLRHYCQQPSLIT
jgi:hypothetical protein